MDLPLLDDFPEADADDPHLLPVGEDQAPGTLLWLEGGGQFRPSSGLQVDVLHCLVRGHLWDELGRTSRKCGGCSHCHSWTPHPMEK